MRMITSVSLAMLTGAMLLPGNVAIAQDARERRMGEGLSRELCSDCHIVSHAQRGPALDGIPSFLDLASSKRTNAQLRAWLTDPHPPMPNVPLSEQEISSVIAYIRSFAD